METPTKTALALATQAGDRTAFGLYRREAGTDVSQLSGLLVRIGTLRCFAGLSLVLVCGAKWPGKGHHSKQRALFWW
jgi:hypothetical protein